MSKEELNRPISDRQTENALIDSSSNNLINLEADLSQNGGESNQNLLQTDKLSSELGEQSQDNNSISADLENVNKQTDSDIGNENSSLSICEPVSSDVKCGQEKPDGATNDELLIKNVEDYTQVSGDSSNPLDTSESTVPGAQQDERSKSEPGSHTSQDLSKEKSDETREQENNSAVNNPDKLERSCDDSGPHFSRSVSENKDNDNKETNEQLTTDEIQTNQAEIDVTNKENQTGVHETGPETECNYQEDFEEESSEKDIKNLNEISQSNGDNETNEQPAFHEISTKPPEVELSNPEDHSVIQENAPNTDDNNDVDIEQQQLSENDTNTLKEISQLDENFENRVIETSDKLNQIEKELQEAKEEWKNAVYEGDPSTENDKTKILKQDREPIINEDTASLGIVVNEDCAKKPLTEVIINEEGVPKVSTTSVQDQPRSGEFDSEETEDPFKDFDIQPSGQDSILHTESNSGGEKADNKSERDEIAISRLVMDEPKQEKHEDGQDNEEIIESNDADTNHNNSEETETVQVNNESASEPEKETIKTIIGENTFDGQEQESGGKGFLDIIKPQAEGENGNKNTETNSYNQSPESKDGKSIFHKNKSKDETGVEDNQSETSTQEIDSKTETKTVTKIDVVKADEQEPPTPTENKPKPPSEPTPKHESPLDQLLKRNVKIDGSIESVTELETNVTTLLKSMNSVMKHYSELLKLQPLKDFTTDLGQFRGDFTSVNEALQRCTSMSLAINQHLKELRHTTEDVKTQIHRKFQQEDLSTWVDVPADKEKEKERLQEQTYAAEKAAMAKAAEARHAMATAVSGVAEAHQLMTELEVQAAEAEATARKAAAQAQVALIAAEEAKIAAEERKRAEEESKKRAEERAKIKQAEEEKKRALEEKKIQQEAAAKGTSVEDERQRFMNEKRRKEEQRKNPKNWPRFLYAVSGVDFNSAVGCVVRAIEGSIRQADIACVYVDQSKGHLKLTETEELVSNIVQIKQVEVDRILLFEEPISVALPVCIGRVPAGKEMVVKKLQKDGSWDLLTSTEVQFEDYRDLKFVEGRCSNVGTFAVVLRPKKDTLQFQRKGSKLLCSSDTRITFANKPGTFKKNVNALLEVTTLDVNAVTDLKLKSPKECGDLLTASPFLKFSIPARSFQKPLTLTAPLPHSQTRQSRPATGITREKQTQDHLRPATARPASTNEDEAAEDIFFLHRDDKTGWTVNSGVQLVQSKSKDIVTFDIAEPYQRMLLLRTKAGKRDAAVEKMATLLEKITTQRNVKIVLRQNHNDVADVMVACTASNRIEKTLKYLEDNNYTEGPAPSRDIALQEGQQMFMRFRGNIECVTKDPPPSLRFIYNTNIRATRTFRVNEKDEFAQKSLPSYRGFVQVYTKALVPKPIPDGAPKNVQPEMEEAEILLTELLVELPKPEAEPPKPLATAPVPLKEGPLNGGVLRYIAGMMGKEWKDVAAQLNLKPMRIQAILRNHLNKDTAETRHEMLVTWAKRVPKAVDKVQILCNALNACGRQDIAEEVRHRGQQYREQRFMNARVSYLRQAFVKVAKTTAVFNRWKQFAKDLGVPDDKIQSIEASGGSGQEKCFSSLETWKDEQGERATVAALADFLKTANQERLSRDVESLVATT